ncbi:hypothetical protein DY000_02009326 [Brassica cretica]|uniref:Uncharacterized protein n=1 Tax=Brassica cretica TaxID=69181 RepID=A0ABQ7CHZ0_BRACR|nr:hypothetical protein DY000_02009326 [Brassica cretica]
MFRQGWDPGEQMVSGDKGRVDLHYYDGIGSEIGERKQKEGSHKLTGLYGFFGNTLLSVLFTTHAAIGLIKPNAVSF